MKRRKREVIISIIIIAVVALLTFVENRIIHFGADIPVSNTILMFILININLLLLLLLIFLVFRNLVKLLYDRKRKVMGTKLRTRLVVAFIALDDKRIRQKTQVYTPDCLIVLDSRQKVAD